MILNIYTPNTGAPRYMKQVLNDLQRDLDFHTIIVGDFNTPLPILDRSNRQEKSTKRGKEQPVPATPKTLLNGKDHRYNEETASTNGQNNQLEPKWQNQIHT